VRWKVAQAKEQLSALLRRAAQGPQEIANREQVVAVVLGGKDLAAFREWRVSHAKLPLSEHLALAQRIAAEEDFELPYEARKDRPNPVLMVNDVGRHKRRQ
jgi:antitoxin (DNA-binding transcriptional repressor) of toxin-antitoxin stability system